MPDCRQYFPYEYLEDVFSIDYEDLFRRGYRALIFDIDNTLVPHGADSTEAVDRLMEKIRKMGFKVLLLSDNNEARIQRFNRNIGALYIAEAGKPSPWPFREAVTMLGVSKREAVVIGDQMFVDILGANRAGLASILVKYIGHGKREWKGWRRYLEKVLLGIYALDRGAQHRITRPRARKKRLFCEISPFTYALSLRKGILVRHLKNLLGRVRFARTRQEDRLEVVVSSHGGDMIKRGPGIDPRLQENKADNIRLACSRMDGLLIRPGETFSFWQTVGKTSRRNGFREGRVIINGRLVSGLGGGLCNLANTLHLLVLESPLKVTELHHHSDALAPDPGGKRVPYSAGTSVNYNFVDFRFRNDTAETFQLCAWCEGDVLCTELRSTAVPKFRYRLVEEDHHFHREADGKYYRISRIYRETLDPETGAVLKRELNWDNHSEVMFDPALIPPEQLR